MADVKLNFDRRLYALPLRKYLNTINLNESPLEYLKHLPRLFTLQMQPKKRDEITRLLEPLYDKVLMGTLSREDITALRNHVRFKNNPAVQKILGRMLEDYDEKQLGFHPTQTLATGTTAVPAVDPSRMNYFTSHFIDRFYYHVTAHGISTTGLFERTQNTLQQLGALIGGLNIALPGASAAAGVIGSAITAAGDKEQGKTSADITETIPRQKIDVIGAALAKLVAERFAYQIQSLYHTGTYTAPMDVLIEEGVKEALQNINKVSDLLSSIPASLSVDARVNLIAEALMQSMVRKTTQSMLPQNMPFLSGHLEHKDDTGIRGDKNKGWTVDALFQQTGLVTFDERRQKLVFYKPPGSSPERYGYAFVNPSEISRRRLFNSEQEVSNHFIKSQYQEIYDALHPTVSLTPTPVKPSFRV